MVPKMPAAGLDPGAGTGFRTRIMLDHEIPPDGAELTIR
jgi:hypothetical protein